MMRLTPYPGSTKALFFVRQDGRWLIQELADIVWLEGDAEPVPIADVVGPQCVFRELVTAAFGNCVILRPQPKNLVRRERTRPTAEMLPSSE